MKDQTNADMKEVLFITRDGLRSLEWVSSPGRTISRVLKDKVRVESGPVADVIITSYREYAFVGEYKITRGAMCPDIFIYQEIE